MAKAGEAEAETSGNEENAANTAVNPFILPPDNDIFILRDREKKRQKEEKEKRQHLSVAEKLPRINKMNFRKAAHIYAEGVIEEQEEPKKSLLVKDDPKFILAVTKNRHVEKESLSDYINKKREMFLIEYSLSVKRDEIKKLEKLAEAEEKKLELAEQYLEEDAAMFDEFLKENDQNTSEANKLADQESKAKQEKVHEIKRINAQLVAMKSQISKFEDQLKDFQRYRKFLWDISPKDWKEQVTQERLRKKELRRLEKERTQTQMTLSEASKTSLKSQQPKIGKTQPAVKVKTRETAQEPDLSGISAVLADDLDSDSEDELIYFSDPQHLLAIFQELEEQNLSLIQNSQDTEEALEAMRQHIAKTKQKMEQEIILLKEQIDKLNTMIERELAKARDAEAKIKMFSFQNADHEEQEKMLDLLNEKVAVVYRNCIGENEANISTLQMMINIENRLEELFEKLESLPPEKVEGASRAKEKERRLRMKEEKAEQLRQHQEDRVKKALERAKAPPRKHIGRRPVYRSRPPMHEKREDKEAVKASKDEEELAYYFT